MMQIQIWILSGLVGFFLMIGWWSIKRWIIKIDSKFDALIKAIEEQGKEQTRQTIETRNLTKRVDSHDKRLNDHAKRLRKIEISNAQSNE